MRDLVELDELYPLMAEVIAKGGTFRFYPRGTSMLPMLREGEDSVELARADAFAEGDVLFYRRSGGAFVLHRLIVAGETLTLCGDHQNMLEYGVRREQVLAKLVGFYKGETYHTVTERDYLAYAKKMVRRFPFYRRNEKLYRFLRKIKHSIIK